MEKKSLNKQVENFSSCFNSLCENKDKGKKKKVKREARMLDIRYRLSLDLRVGIETEYSSTKDKAARETYELLFKFMDLWNVYEACQKYGRKLSVFPVGDKKIWNENFLKKNGLKDCLEKHVKLFKSQFLSKESDWQTYKEYLEHFSELPGIYRVNRDRYRDYIAAGAKAFDYEQLLFVQYMERNAFYHGGEAAKSEVGYAYRKKLLKFYIDFLKEFIALLGAQLFLEDSAR